METIPLVAVVTASEDVSYTCCCYPVEFCPWTPAAGTAALPLVTSMSCEFTAISVTCFTRTGEFWIFFYKTETVAFSSIIKEIFFSFLDHHTILIDHLLTEISIEVKTSRNNPL